MKYFSFLPILCLSPVVAMEAGSFAPGRPFLPRAPLLMKGPVSDSPLNEKTKSHSVLEIPRGGAGPVDPEILAKICCVSSAMYGLLMSLAPKLVLDKLPKDQNPASAEYFTTCLGTSLLSNAILYYCLFFAKTSLPTAFQAFYVLWAIESLRDILNDTPVKSGVKDSTGVKFLFAISIFAIHSMSQDYAISVIKGLSVFWAIVGGLQWLAPEIAMDLWKVDKTKISKHTKGSFLALGYITLAIAVFGGSIVFLDATNAQAAGYAAIVHGTYNLVGILNGHFKEVGESVGQIGLWGLFQAFVVFTTLM